MESRWGNSSCRSQGNERKIFISLNAPFTILCALCIICDVNIGTHRCTLKGGGWRGGSGDWCAAQCNLNLWGRAGMCWAGAILGITCLPGETRIINVENGDSAPTPMPSKVFSILAARSNPPLGAVNDSIPQSAHPNHTKYGTKRQKGSFDSTRQNILFFWCILVYKLGQSQYLKKIMELGWRLGIKLLTKISGLNRLNIQKEFISLFYMRLLQQGW